jgi:NADPH:quinone reductase-like Zn-dependent oxidoreductase
VQVTEVEDPVPGSDEIRVEVHATTVNRTDCGYRSGTPFFIRAFSGLRRPRHAVLGTELAGVVDRVGGPGAPVEEGDRVFAYVEGTFGAHAELVVLPASGSLARIPDGVDFEQAAAATEGAHYALSNFRAAGVGAGSDVLVYGATGAIGSAAVQLGVAMGARVTAVCATDHLELVAGLGAHRVVDYTAQDFTDDPQTYDMVFDAVGKSTWAACRSLLAPQGRYTSTDLGPHAQNAVLPLLTRLRRGPRMLFPFPQVDAEMVSWFADLLADGRFRPVIDSVRPLDEIVDAYRRVETGQKLGNVVIAVDEDTRRVT